MIKKLKEKKYYIILYIIVLLLISYSSAYAVTYLYAAKDVSYSNTNSGLEANDVQDAIDEVYTIADEYQNLKNSLYPVGSIYMSTTESSVEDVEEKLGGTWKKIENKFLIGANSSYEVNTTGGTADAVVVSHNHTFSGNSVTTSSAGAHTHTTSCFQRNWYVVKASSGSVAANANGTRENTTSSSAGAHTHTVTAAGSISTVGVSETGKNIPPYYAVYIYKRTK